MFHPKVTASSEAILKNEVAVCWGWVRERMSAGEFGETKTRLKLEIAWLAIAVDDEHDEWVEKERGNSCRTDFSTFD